MVNKAKALATKIDDRGNVHMGLIPFLSMTVFMMSKTNKNETRQVQQFTC